MTQAYPYGFFGRISSPVRAGVGPFRGSLAAPCFGGDADPILDRGMRRLRHRTRRQVDGPTGTLRAYAFGVNGNVRFGIFITQFKQDLVFLFPFKERDLKNRAFLLYLPIFRKGVKTKK